MRIEVVCASRELFGADRSAVRLAALLRDLGHEVELAVPAARRELGLSELAARHRLAVRPAPIAVVSRRGVSGPGALLPRRRSAAELTIYNSAAVAARAGDRRPRLLMLREWLDPGWRRHRALCGYHRRRVDAVVAVSGPVAERWRACAGDRLEAEVCPNWIGEDWLAEPDDGAREGVLFCGRLNQWKGQMVLADAFGEAFGSSADRPSLTFLGAEGPASPFHANARVLRRRCEDSGWRLLDVASDPRPVLASAALVVVPSLRPEPFGNVVLEALAAGARVLAFPGGGIDELAPLFPGTVEVVPRDRGALAAALRRWFDAGAGAQDPGERERTLATLRARFSAAAVAPIWRRILARLSQPSARSASS